MKYIFYILAIIAIACLGALAGFMYSESQKPPKVLPAKDEIINTPLNKYTIQNLSQATIEPGSFQTTETLKEEDEFTSHLFNFKFDPALTNNEQKAISGIINIPKNTDNAPVILMLRGFVDQEIYTSGMGTSRAAEEFAKNGYITIAPDFLGYADSDSESADIFESRFQTYTTVLSLISTLNSESFSEATNNLWDENNLFIWAHSNGGHIALTTLAITGRDFPATLWAPVSKPFPYSILYYTDEAEDKGKFLRRKLAEFEQIYDVENYNFTNHLDRINTTIQIHQGTADDAIPLEWTNQLVQVLENQEQELEISYHTYPSANHNLTPGWDTVVQRDIEFFLKNTR